MEELKKRIEVLEARVAEGRYFEDEKIVTVLSKETIELFKEIDAFHTQIAIDKVLDERDEAAFIRLTGGKQTMKISKELLDYVADADNHTILVDVPYSTSLREIVTIDYMIKSYERGEVA